jgi:hypothetical protein
MKKCLVNLENADRLGLVRSRKNDNARSSSPFALPVGRDPGRAGAMLAFGGSFASGTKSQVLRGSYVHALPKIPHFRQVGFRSSLRFPNGSSMIWLLDRSRQVTDDAARKPH